MLVKLQLLMNPQHGDFLILNELQLRYKPNIPKRMRAYAALAEERYDLPTYPVLVNILPPSVSMQIASRYESEFMGLQARQDYCTINLWEVDADRVFQQPLPTLLPFVPVLRGGGEESMVRRALQMLRTNEQLSELEPLLAFFAGFVLETRLVQQIMRWDMAVLRESPWYQEILREGQQQGQQQGRQEGRQQGRQEGELALIIRLLNRRIGSVEPQMQERLQGLSIDWLEDLGEALLDFERMTDLEAWLQEHQQTEN
ncbi:DUF4351 domain-containing protein [Argonema antarcticum]|uniref:DUF4351 domain-containing protein n=1 Tax=Argonema antarcticum TaxID=2942763 RepID=UPI0020115324|nr:DUF4351 domain-containing protein [Argonema antarcticum]MCL1473920.1 DUF4351 domain-containing protein [Argonema antarcticum A004/B2]